jgi:hypothetical protein
MIEWKVVREEPIWHKTTYEGCLSTNRKVKVTVDVEKASRHLYLTVLVGTFDDYYDWAVGTIEYTMAVSFLENNRDMFLTAGVKLTVDKAKKEIAAEAKAKKLLYGLLTPAQKRNMTKKEYFYEQGRVTGRWYKFSIDSDIIEPCEFKYGKLQVVPPPRYGSTPYYCMQISESNGELPWADRIVAQLLLVRTNEMKFRRIANYHDGHYGREVHRLTA